MPGEALARAEATVREPFDLIVGAIFRVVLYRTAQDEHLLLICIHHIGADQWSLGIIGRELAALYNAAIGGKQADLLPLDIRYSDYVNWEQKARESPAMERQVAFWRERLAGVPVLALPADRQRRDMPSLQGALHVVPMSAELVAGLELLSRRERSTLFMTMFAAFAALLHRLTGQDDIAVGVPIAGRQQSEVEPLVGTFVNTLVLRADLSGNPSFVTLMQRAKKIALDAFAHQDVPLERLSEDLVRQRQGGRAPLLQVLFNVQNAPMHGIGFHGLSWEPLMIDRGGAAFELSLMVDPQVTRSLVLEFDTDLFDLATIERFAARYLEILGAVVEEPSRTLHALPLLPAHERQLIASWNATDVPIPPEAVLSRRFEACVARQPLAPAVSFQGLTLNYGELNARSNRVARSCGILAPDPAR